jgi:putative ABC transport system substrate-binding protein
VLVGVTAGQLAPHAQQSGKVYRIAWVAPSEPVDVLNESSGHRGYRALIEELRRLGYFEGQNLTFERYSGGGRSESYGQLANDVARRKPDLIFTVTTIAQFLKSAMIPIVAITGDPVTFGLAASLAHPGGNFTGVSPDPEEEIWGKRMQYLKEIVPEPTRVGFLVPRRWWEGQEGTIVRREGQQMGISVVGPPLEGTLQEEEYRRVFEAMSQDHVNAVIVDNVQENLTNRRIIVDLAEKVGLPTMYPWRDHVDLGGLMAYAPAVPDLWRHAAQQIDQIFKGAKPGDIPIYRATRFELILNLKTAQTLGLTFPPSLLALADEIIE